MKENLSKILKMEVENILIKMVTYMKENLEMIYQMEKEF